jgi:hypothetical protein
MALYSILWQDFKLNSLRASKLTVQAMGSELVRQ